MRYINKQFLSDDYDESGSLVLKCETPKDIGSEEDVLDRVLHSDKVWVDASAQFRDCYSKPIDLCFSFNDEKGYNKRIAKVEKMVSMLTEFKEQLTVHWEDVKERSKEG